MPTFECLVADTMGKVECVTVTAPDENAAIRAASSKNRITIRVRAVAERKASSAKSRKIRNAVLEFTEMMEILTSSGLSLKDSLEITASMNARSEMGKLAGTLATSVRKGTSFAQAVDASPNYFSEIYRGMVAVGDKTGTVERIFPRLAIYLRDKKALADKIAGAMAYPIMVLSVAVFGSIGLGIFVMPKLGAIFEGFGGDASAKVSLNIRNIELSFIAIGSFAAAIVAAVPIIKACAARSERLSLAIDGIKLSLPVVGKFITALETLNFAFAMETLTLGGVPVESAIEEAAKVVSNVAYKRALMAVRSDLLKGISLSQAFPQRRAFPRYVSQWMIVGEKSGKTERVFSQLRTYFQSEVERMTGKFMTLIEPAMILLIGGFMIVLIISVVLPLFSLYGNIL